MVDGIAGMDMATVLLDSNSDPEQPAAVTPWTPEPSPSAVRMVVSGLRDAVLEPLQQLARVPGLVRNLPTRREILCYSRGLMASARRMASPSAWVLNGPVGPHRRWEWAQADVNDVKLVRSTFGGTVNDVVLAAVTRGFRDLLAARGELTVGQVVRSLVPVSVRAKHERGTLNNRISAVLVNLPVGEPDPVARLARLREQMDDLKGNRQAVGAQALTELAGFAAPTLLAMGTRLIFRTRNR
jgi:diacylglycerol O-acyltransferase / wax synthase